MNSALLPMLSDIPTKIAGLVCAGAASVMLLAGCGQGKSPDSGAPDDVLLAVGDSALTLADVVGRIPVGLAPADSALMFSQIVDSWIEDMLLTGVAAENIDNIDEIDRKVKRYRNQLIIGEYMSKMRSSRQHDVSDAAVRQYYEAHADDMLLEVPLIKGIYLKVPSDAERMADLRRWIFNPTGENIDRLETYGLAQALQYDYFGERWTDWNIVADQIPYRFYDPDAFLESTHNFETSYNGSTYLLHVSDYLPSGSKTPFEFAAPGIEASLNAGNMARHQRRMMLDLCSKAIDEGRLQVVGYDLTERRATITANKNRKGKK